MWLKWGATDFAYFDKFTLYTCIFISLFFFACKFCTTYEYKLTAYAICFVSKYHCSVNYMLYDYCVQEITLAMFITVYYVVCDVFSIANLCFVEDARNIE